MVPVLYVELSPILPCFQPVIDLGVFTVGKFLAVLFLLLTVSADLSAGACRLSRRYPLAVHRVVRPCQQKPPVAVVT